jgi:glucokinase
MVVLGMDIGGSSLKVVLREKEKILKKEVFNLPREKKELFGLIEKIYKNFSQKNKLEKVGIGVAGILDKNREKIMRAPNLSFLEGVKITEEIEKRLKRKVFIENDVNCFGLGEKFFGKAKNLNYFIFLALGSGIGGAIFVNGKLILGKEGGAGEIGHIFLDIKNKLDFEELASDKFLKRKLKKNTFEAKNLAEKGEKRAIEAFKELGKNLGFGIVNLIHIFDPEAIILGGGVILARKFFEKEMKETIKKFIISKSYKTKILFSNLGRFGGAIGASFLEN